MATLATNVLTLADMAKRMDPDGKTARIAELLGQTNAILDDMMFKECNDTISERATIRTGLPTVYWRMINQPVQVTKSNTAQVTFGTAMMDAWSEIDKDEAEMSGNVNAYRMSEASAFLEAMNQEMASTLFYGSAATPEEFVGLSNHYASLSANNAQNIINAGGTGSDNTSVWLIGWGKRTVYGIFPKGSKAGIQHEDMGLQTIEGTSGSGNGVAGTRMRVYQEHWTWKNGLVVKDWRYAVRIANIDVSTLVADTGGSTINLINNMVKAIHRLPTTQGRQTDQGYEGVRPCFYANRTVLEMLDVQASNKSNLHLKSGEEEGKQKVTLRGIPVKACDAITEAESLVS